MTEVFEVDVERARMLAEQRGPRSVQEAFGGSTPAEVLANVWRALLERDVVGSPGDVSFEAVGEDSIRVRGPQQQERLVGVAESLDASVFPILVAAHLLREVLPTPPGDKSHKMRGPGGAPICGLLIIDVT